MVVLGLTYEETLRLLERRPLFFLHTNLCATIFAVVLGLAPVDHRCYVNRHNQLHFLGHS